MTQTKAPAWTGEPVAWYDLNPRRDGSPCVIRRVFERYKTAVNRLGRAETKLAEAEKANAPERKLTELKGKVAHFGKRENYARQVLQNTVRFALARIRPNSDDGKELARRHPEVKVSTRGARNKKHHKQIEYYANVVDEYILAKTMRSGATGSKEAAEQLMARSSNLISFHKIKSPREGDDAEQQAFFGIDRACEKFMPHRGFDGKDEEINAGSTRGLARLSTYASNWIRRMMEARKSSECPPGMYVGPGAKKGYTSSLHVEAGDDNHADRFHPAVEVDQGFKNDVDEALKMLDPLERELVTRVLMHGTPLNDIAREKEISARKLGRVMGGAKEKLAHLLSAHQAG